MSLSILFLLFVLSLTSLTDSLFMSDSVYFPIHLSSLEVNVSCSVTKARVVKLCSVVVIVKLCGVVIVKL